MNFGSKSNDVFQQLKCDVCENYLSHFPVYTTPDERNFCGRCEKYHIPTISHRNVIYETLAQFVEFPCQYTKNGCTKVGKPNDIANHELNCPVKPHKCPMNDFDIQCDWEGLEHGIQNHCQDKHSELLLEKPSFSVELDHCLTKIVTKLVKNNSILYILQLKLLENNHPKLFLGSVNKKIIPSGNCLITIKSGNLDWSFLIDYDLQKQVIFDILLDLKSLSEISVTLVFEISNTIQAVNQITENKEDFKLDLDMLDNFTCTKCTEIFLPPYYGYICDSSNNYLLKCEKCNLDRFGNYISTKKTRFLNLEKIAEITNFPCRNRYIGCKFMSTPQIMKEHVISCQYKKVTCPIVCFPPCCWMDSGLVLKQHILDCHRKKFLKTSIITEKVNIHPKVYDPGQNNTYITKYGDDLFILYFRIKNNFFYWDVQPILPSNFEYSFELTISSKNFGKLVRQQLCGASIQSMKDVEDKKRCFFTHEQLKDVIMLDTIIFSINIYQSK